MYCPNCNTEYRDGFTTCSDCGATLAAGTPPPTPGEQPIATYDVARLVEVLTTDDLSRADVAASILGGEGINALVRPWLPSGLALSSIERPFPGQQVVVCVPEPHADEAREILASLLPSLPIEDRVIAAAPIEPGPAPFWSRNRLVAVLYLLPIGASVVYGVYKVAQALLR